MLMLDQAGMAGTGLLNQNYMFPSGITATAPAIGFDVPTGAAAAQPAQPFVWGAGGTRLTPEQIELRQRAALSAQQPDYSPVQSPWQGVARVAGNVAGALQQRDLDKQSAAAQADRQHSVEALLAAGSPGSALAPSTSAVATALLSNDPVAQKLGMAQWERDHPKPVNNDSAQDWAFYQQNLTPDQFEQWKANRVYNPPHFAVIDGAPAMVGGYQPSSGQPAANPPATLPADFDFGGK